MKFDRLELDNSGKVSVVYNYVLFDEEGNEVVTGKLHRETFNPGEDISALPSDTQATINAHWTTERVAAWQAIISPL